MDIISSVTFSRPSTLSNQYNSRLIPYLCRPNTYKYQFFPRPIQPLKGCNKHQSILYSLVVHQGRQHQGGGGGKAKRKYNVWSLFLLTQSHNSGHFQAWNFFLLIFPSFSLYYPTVATLFLPIPYEGWFIVLCETYKIDGNKILRSFHLQLSVFQVYLHSNFDHL